MVHRLGLIVSPDIKQLRTTNLQKKRLIKRQITSQCHNDSEMTQSKSDVHKKNKNHHQTGYEPVLFSAVAPLT